MTFDVSFANKVESSADACNYLKSSKLMDEIAQDVLNVTRRLGIDFVGKTCLDVGCGSGENTIAIAQAGAKNINGIDPDDHKIGVAKAKETIHCQFIKTTLQEYHNQFPNKQFDIVTVFQWNILFKERENFCSALTKAVKPEGIVVISYFDEMYETDPWINIPDLVSRFWDVVAKPRVSDGITGWVRHILICSKPRVV